MSYSKGMFNLTATKLEYWHRHAKNCEKTCVFCKGDFEKIATLLNNAGLTVMAQGVNFVRITAVTNYRCENGGMSDETHYLYLLITADNEKEFNEIFKEEHTFDTYNEEDIRKKAETPTPQQLSYVKRLYKQVYKKEYILDETKTKSHIADEINELMEKVSEEQTENPKKVKASFARWINNQLYELLKEKDFPYTEFLDLPSSIFNSLHTVIKKSKKIEDIIWANADYSPNEEELRLIVEKEMIKMGKKKSSDKQKQLFNELCKKLGVVEEVPSNHLVLLQKIATYKQQTFNMSPATEKQINAVNKMYKHYHGTELGLKEATRETIQRYFEEFEELKEKK